MSIKQATPEVLYPVEDYIEDTILVAWDGCHKIYLALDQDEADWFLENYPEVVQSTPEAMLATVIDWYERSCWLRFVNAVQRIDGNPEAEFIPVVEQFADEKNDDDEDEDYYEDEDDEDEDDED